MTKGVSQESRADALAAASAALDKQARDVVVLDVHGHLVITDFFVVATGMSQPQVRTIVAAIEEALRLRGRRPIRREGEVEGRWVLLDFADFVVHVFAEDERDFYDLERLWGDAPRVPLGDAASTAG